MRVDQEQGLPKSLEEIRQEIETGLDHYLKTRGPERSALTIRLLRLMWAAEDLEAANQVG